MKELEKTLKAIKPKPGSELKERKFIGNAIAKLKKEIKGAKIALAGSFAKGTFLEGDRDIDIFVLFHHTVEKDAMEGIVRGAVENAFPKAHYEIAYAQHPYVRLFLEGRKMDIVPAYEAGHGRHFELKTAVDRSQLHTEYINSKMSRKQKDEVRLLKKFLKVNGLYGAEIRVQGLSGYLCELLILKYSSFAAAMESIGAWKQRAFIDLEGKAKEQDALAKFETPLVVIDPVDENRNVSAVVSPENYSALIMLARSFLKAKNKAAFFEKREPGAAQLKKFLHGKRIYCMSFAAPKIVDDILWGQVRRFYSAFSAAMKKEGFEIIGHATDRCGNEICILIELLNEPLPENKLVLGPPIEFEKDCAKFASQYSDVFIHEGRMAAKARRDARTMEEMMKRIRKLPLPSHLSSARNAKLYKAAKAIERCRGIIQKYAVQKLLV